MKARGRGYMDTMNNFREMTRGVESEDKLVAGPGVPGSRDSVEGLTKLAKVNKYLKMDT